MKSSRLVGHAYVRNVHTEHTHNGSTPGNVDLIELANGKVLAINSEVVVLYPDLKAYMAGVDASDFPTIEQYGDGE